MGRPKRVFPHNLKFHTIKHTVKVKMMSGVEMTALHLLKETEHYYIGIESWAFCCSKYKCKKEKAKIEFNIPIIKDEKTIEFLNKKAWKDYVEERKDSQDMIEAVSFLNGLFPNKKAIYFYELEPLIGSYCYGSFSDDRNDEDRKYYNFKYQGMTKLIIESHPENIKKYYEAYLESSKNNEDDKITKKKYNEYRNLSDNFILENYDLTDIFESIGINSIVCPYIFTNQTMKGYSYENVGEIYFVVTDDCVYFETTRHF